MRRTPAKLVITCRHLFTFFTDLRTGADDGGLSKFPRLRLPLSKQPHLVHLRRALEFGIMEKSYYHNLPNILTYVVPYLIIPLTYVEQE